MDRIERDAVNLLTSFATLKIRSIEAHCAKVSPRGFCLIGS